MADSKVAHGGDASRRAVVGGFLGVGVAAPLLVACGAEESSGSGDSGESGESAGESGDSAAGSPPSSAIGKTSEVPVGSGRIYKAEKVVVTQPTEGEFKAFSSICTHRQCPVTKIEGKDISCTCHGSKFSIADGSVTDGPAEKPLEEFQVTVAGEEITVS
jgi:nitrite reductase/ring-hydroxylating ferredoxin subunit